MDVGSDYLSRYGKKREPETCTCIVKNLDDSVTKAQLEDLFSRHGEVKEVVIKKTNAVIGSVEMSNLKEAEDAKNELDGYEFKGHILEVQLRKPPGLLDLKPTKPHGGKYEPVETERASGLTMSFYK